MLHPLEQRLIAVGSRARRLLVSYAIAWVVGIAMVVLILLGLADYLFHFDDRGVRVIATLSLIGATAWAAVRFLLPALHYQPTNVQLAQRVEKLHPELRGRLASTIEFLNQSEDDPTAGSPELRRIAIAEMAATTDDMNWADVIDSRPTKRVSVVAGAIVIASLIFAAVFPVHAATALLRLVNPLGNAHWPRNHYLAIEEPVRRIASGQSFEVKVIDETGKLPEAVFIQYRWHAPGEPVIEEQERMDYAEGAMVARQESVTRPFEYRVFGGDDDTMPWTAVEVIEPPQLESVNIVVTPPAYTGFKPYPAGDRIEAIIGSSVSLSGKTTGPIASAKLYWGDEATFQAALVAGGGEFSFAAADSPLIVKRSGQYRLEITDNDGLTTEAARGDIYPLADPPPTISLDRPTAGLFTTPSAAVAIKTTVKDNLAIRSITIVYRRTDKPDEGESRIELFAGPEVAAPQSGTPHSATGQSLTIDDRWDLSPLNLPPGMQLTFHVAADDYQPKTGVSTARKITIVTPAELEQRISIQQATILAELAGILQLERDVRSSTVNLHEQLSQVGTLTKANFDLLQTAELNQRQVRRALASRADGVLSQVANLAAEVESNRLDSPEITRRLQQMSAAIEQLEAEPLPRIEREMTTAVKEGSLLLAASQSPETALIRKSLELSSAGQDEVIVALEKLIDELTEWSHYRGLAKDIGQIRAEQAALQKQTQQIGVATIALDAQSLSPQQRADLAAAARTQIDLAGRLGKLLTQMDRMVQQAGEDAKFSAETIGDALQIARQQNLAGLMRDGADQIGGNHIGQAIEQQTAVLRGLDEMLDALSNSREHELSRLVKKIRDAEKRIDDIRIQQEELRKKLARLVKQSEQPGANQEEIKAELQRLQREQRRLEQETKQLAKQLLRLQAEKAAQSTASAGNKMSEAGERANQNKPQEALDEATKAKQDLDEAQKQLAERRRQVEQDLAHEQIAKIGDALKGLAERQSQIVEETLAYDVQRNKPSGLTRAQSQSVLDLSRNEAMLSGDSKALAEKVAAAEVFELALQRAAAEMEQAAVGLAKLETGEDTQRAANAALRRLQQIAEALKRDPAANPPKPSDGGEGGGGGGNRNQPPADMIALLAEVKLLKMMQEQVNLRTRALDEATKDAPMLTAAQRQEYIELAKEQGKLAELILKKSAPLEPLLDEDPESLPDVRREEETK